MSNVSTEQANWQKRSEAGSTFMLRFIRWLALHVSEGAARLCLYPITAYFLIVRRAERRASRNYLRRVLGREPSLRDVARHIHTFATTILDRVFLLTGRFNTARVRVHGQDLLRATLRDGRGMLLFGSHFGSFEAVRAVGMAHENIQLRILMDYQHNARLTEMLDSLNPRARDSMIDAGAAHSTSTLLQIHETLQQGGLVGILADRVRGQEHALPCTLLGRRAMLPSSPLRIAATLKCPVMLIFGVLRPDNTYDVYFEPFADVIDLGPRAQREQQLQLWLDRYAQQLERRVLDAPYNWFNFYEFWPS